MYTTLLKIESNSPCPQGWRTLLKALGKTKADDEPVSLAFILQSNGLEDAIWALRCLECDREVRLFAVEVARQVEPLLTDKRSVAALDVAERFANGLATSEELAAARDAACAATDAAYVATAAACGAAWDAARDAACAAVYDAASDAAYYAACAATDAAYAAAYAAARGAAWDAAYVATAAARGAAWDAARGATCDAARGATRGTAYAAARTKQKDIFLKYFGSNQ